MRCYRCNATLSEKSYCTGCGADVKIYKKIISLSNLYYNDGLEKAKVRDLSGAIISLRKSLKFNKRNYMARNLLGLIYFEVGETVAALGQWIISTNQRPKKNLAEDYMKILSANQGKLDSINQTIRKYNLSLEYCRQGSYDLAVIQLKKLLSVNTHLVQGHQLLALLYMQEKSYEKAMRQLQKAIQIDSSNTVTLHYVKEVKSRIGNTVHKTATRNDEGMKVLRQSKDRVEYRSGNEMIIQPTNIKENNGMWTIINIVIGLVIGAAVTGFLIVPSQIQAVKNKYSEKENESYEQIQAKNAEIDGLNAQLQQMQATVDSVNGKLASYEGDSGIVKGLVNLMEAETLREEGNITGAFELLATIPKDSLPEQAQETFRVLYDGMVHTILEKALNEYKNKGNCETAVKYYQQVLKLDGMNEEAMYHCGVAFKKNEQINEAKEMLGTYLTNYPEGKYADVATDALEELQEPQE